MKAELEIPVMLDDQHGTAIISSASLLNALDIVGKKIEEVRVVVSGAGASAMSCSRLYISLGVKPENLIMCDSKGTLHVSRKDLDELKKPFATHLNLHTMGEALKGADVFLGLSVANVLKKEMVQSMAENPIVFALANPNPEISYEEAMSSRTDLIFATGRSDYANQVNNVLGFPFIFRGALDVRATAINEDMKIAAVKALANLAKEPVPEIVSTAYSNEAITFGRNYIIPKPLDPRLISRVSVAVAQAAIESGVARYNIENWEEYANELERRLGLDNALIRNIRTRIKKSGKRIVYAEGSRSNVIKAAQLVAQEQLAHPILLGNEKAIREEARNSSIDLTGIEIVEFYNDDHADVRAKYAQALFHKRERDGITYGEALRMMHSNEYFGTMMVEMGDADAHVSGYSSKYSRSVRPIKDIIGTDNEGKYIAGMYIVMTKRGPVFLADSTLTNPNPDADSLVAITQLIDKAVKSFNIEPVIALISHSNFGAVPDGEPIEQRKAIQILHTQHPEIIIDGEVQAGFALDKEARNKRYPFSKWGDKEINTLVFPNHSSASISYNLLKEIGGFEIVGPILLGLEKPVHVLQLESKVRDIVNISSIAILNAMK
ncbi:MAG: phosphate acyltransferase [Mangrovibacterium sp.]